MTPNRASEAPAPSEPAPAHLPTSMRAITAPRYGGSEVLREEIIDVPTTGPDEVLIEVAAAGIDRGVVHLLSGSPRLIRVLGFGFRRPKQPVLGLDVAGTVVAVGRDVTRFTIGDAVFGVGTATYADYAVAPEKKLSRVPTGVSMEDAAVTAISGATALQALTDHGHLEAGQSVLVIGASGGVGSFAVQIAHALGGRVTAVASASKAEAVAALGAERVVDYATEDYLADGSTYDLIIDAGGLNPIRRLRDALTPTGRLVIVGGEGGSTLTGGIERNLRAAILSLFNSRKLTAFISREHHDNSDRLAEFLAAGTIRPLITRRYPLEQAAQGIADLSAGRVTGKAVVVVRNQA